MGEIGTIVFSMNPTSSPSTSGFQITSEKIAIFPLHPSAMKQEDTQVFETILKGFHQLVGIQEAQGPR